MELALFLYLTNFVSNLSLSLFLLLIPIGIGGLVTILWPILSSERWGQTKEEYKEELKSAKGYSKTLLTIFCILLPIFVIIPSEKTMYLMAGGYAAQKVVQSPIADKTLRILEDKMDSYIKEAEEKVNKKKKE